MNFDAFPSFLILSHFSIDDASLLPYVSRERTRSIVHETDHQLFFLSSSYTRKSFSGKLFSFFYKSIFTFVIFDQIVENNDSVTIFA